MNGTNEAELALLGRIDRAIRGWFALWLPSLGGSGPVTGLSRAPRFRQGAPQGRKLAWGQSVFFFFSRHPQGLYTLGGADESGRFAKRGGVVASPVKRHGFP